jgi:hypothetical protein
VAGRLLFGPQADDLNIRGSWCAAGVADLLGTRQRDDLTTRRPSPLTRYCDALVAVQGLPLSRGPARSHR